MLSKYSIEDYITILNEIREKNNLAQLTDTELQIIRAVWVDADGADERGSSEGDRKQPEADEPGSSDSDRKQPEDDGAGLEPKSQDQAVDQVGIARLKLEDNIIDEISVPKLSELLDGSKKLSDIQPVKEIPTTIENTIAEHTQSNESQTEKLPENGDVKPAVSMLAQAHSDVPITVSPMLTQVSPRRRALADELIKMMKACHVKDIKPELIYDLEESQIQNLIAKTREELNQKTSKLLLSSDAFTDLYIQTVSQVTSSALPMSTGGRFRCDSYYDNLMKNRNMVKATMEEIMQEHQIEINEHLTPTRKLIFATIAPLITAISFASGGAPLEGASRKQPIHPNELTRLAPAPSDPKTESPGQTSKDATKLANGSTLFLDTRSKPADQTSSFGANQTSSFVAETIKLDYGGESMMSFMRATSS